MPTAIVQTLDDRCPDRLQALPANFFAVKTFSSEDCLRLSHDGGFFSLSTRYHSVDAMSVLSLGDSALVFVWRVRARKMVGLLNGHVLDIGTNSKSQTMAWFLPPLKYTKNVPM